MMNDGRMTDPFTLIAALFEEQTGAKVNVTFANAAQLTCCADEETAALFLEFLQTDPVWEIWAQYGYEKVEPVAEEDEKTPSKWSYVAGSKHRCRREHDAFTVPCSTQTDVHITNTCIYLLSASFLRWFASCGNRLVAQSKTI